MDIDEGYAEMHADDYIASIKEGMDLRDWFAGKFLTGYLAAGNEVPYYGEDIGKSVAQVLAENAFFMADAMMEARKK